MSGTICCIFLTSWTTPNFPAATSPIAIIFFPQESNLKCRKDLGKALHLVLQRWKHKHVVSSRVKAYLWNKIIRVTLNTGEYEILSSVDQGRKYKLRKLFCSACLGKPRVWHRKFWRSLRNGSFGNREYIRKVVQNMKDRLGHNESVWEMCMDLEKIHISIWTRFMASSMKAALHMDPSYEKNLEIFKNSEFENIRGLFSITKMMIEGNSEIKNVFSADVASSLWEKPVLLKEQ